MLRSGSINEYLNDSQQGISSRSNTSYSRKRSDDSSISAHIEYSNEMPRNEIKAKAIRKASEPVEEKKAA